MIRFFHWQCSASDADWPLVGACHSVAHGSWLLQATEQPTTGEQVGNERATRSSHDGQLQQRFCLLSCLNRCTMRTCSLLGQTAACLTAEVCHLAALPASSHLPRQRVQCSLAAARRALFLQYHGILPVIQALGRGWPGSRTCLQLKALAANAPHGEMLLLSY
jgi:hypothetical protein